MKSNWVWTPDWHEADQNTARIVYFRKSFRFTGTLPANKSIRISADSRYKLYVNDVFVQEGPQKALSLKEWYVDPADIGPFLRQGENVIAVEVLRYPAMVPGTANANDSLKRTELPNLFVDDADNQQPALAGESGWLCRVNREIRIFGENGRPAPIHAQEDVHATDAFAGWKQVKFDASGWQQAVLYPVSRIPVADAPGNLTPRSIPPMRHEDRMFDSVSAIRECGNMDLAVVKEQAEALLAKKRMLFIPAHETCVIEISAGAEECGYLQYELLGGKDARITTLCSECYAYPQQEQLSDFGTSAMMPLKGDRTDAVNGKLFGHTSFYKVAGYGTENKPETYEPYWFRTFRFIQLKIETEKEPLTIRRFSYRSTGYPLDIQTSCETSDESLASIWDISVRTLERCMHETYMDCPFYEQLQYAMDTRSEILYTYSLSADDRLARQAMEAFRLSQRSDGMTQADAPTQRSNVIPGFSIFYLLMVHDHMMYFGDLELVKRHLPAVDQILSCFDRHSNAQGLVNSIGGIHLLNRYWSFIDWSEKWDSGVPGAVKHGPITMESLLYLYGLQKAAELADFAERPGIGSEYRQRAEQLRLAIRKNCMGHVQGQALVQDGPGLEEYSVHCQVFAVLTGLVTAQEGKAMLQATVHNSAYAQASVAFMFYLFRALEICGWYEETYELWNLWRKMVKDHLTTCVENDTDARSDCHAWASLLCYEIPSVILGVRPAAPGYKVVRITPQMQLLESAKGNVITPQGTIHVEWVKEENGSCNLSYEIPESMSIVLSVSHNTKP